MHFALANYLPLHNIGGQRVHTEFSSHLTRETTAAQIKDSEARGPEIFFAAYFRTQMFETAEKLSFTAPAKNIETFRDKIPGGAMITK